MEGGKRLRRALYLMIAAFSFVVPASSQTTDSLADLTIAELLSQTFLPQGAQLAGPQGAIFGVLLPFIIVFTLIYVGMRRMDVLGRRETQVLALAIALFLIPSGGYRTISQFLLALFGVGAEGLVIPGIGVSPEISFLSGLTEIQRCGVVSLIVGGVVGLILNAGPPEDQSGDDGGDWLAMFGKRGFSVGEFLITLVFISATWLTMCGPGPLITAFGWLLVFIVGFKLLSAYYVAGGGGLPALLSIVGLLVIAMLLRSQEMLPEAIRNIGTVILQATVGIIALVIIMVLLLAYIALNTR